MRKRLIEKFEKDWKNIENIKPVSIKLNESNRLIEANGNTYNCLSCYKIPVWKLDEKNLNGRVYPRSLAEKLVRENKVTVALDGHPEDDNYVPLLKDVIAVGKNPVIEENILWVYCYFVDEEYDRKAHRIMDLGFPLQQSSSGLGEVDDFDTVISETYELERYFDLLVQDSSYQVFTSKENEVVDVPVQKIEKQKENKSLSESVTIINRNTSFDENKKKDKSMDKSLKLNVKSLIREAESKENLTEKNRLLKEAYNAVKDEVTLTELKKVITEKIRSTDIELAKLANKGIKAVELSNKLKESISKLTETEKENKKLKEEKVLLVKAVKESSDSLKKIKESAKKKIEKSIDISNKNKTAFNKVKESANKNGELVKKSVNILYALREKFYAVEFRNDALTRKIARLIKENQELQKQLKEDGLEDLLARKRYNNKTPDFVSRRRNRVRRSYETPEGEEEITENEDEDENFIGRKRAVSRNRNMKNRNRRVGRNYETPEVEDDETVEADEFSQTKEVASYFKDTVRNKPFLESFKKEILTSKTVEDAMFKVMQIEADQTDSSQFKLNMMNEKVAKINDGKDIQHNLEVGLLNKRKGWV
jgi:hypothetical protein